MYSLVREKRPCHTFSEYETPAILGSEVGIMVGGPELRRSTLPFPGSPPQLASVGDVKRLRRSPGMWLPPTGPESMRGRAGKSQAAWTHTSFACCTPAM